MCSALVLCAKDCWRLPHTQRRNLYAGTGWPLGQVERGNRLLNVPDAFALNAVACKSPATSKSERRQIESPAAGADLVMVMFCEDKGGRFREGP